MPNTIDQNNPDLNVGDIIYGYTIKRIAELQEIDSIFYELEHNATGARHVHISNADTENTFGVALKTVPVDATGVAHILEHTVLCGSRKFPVRDPFFSMLKRSLSTFMNAFTASDWTMYPFSTENRKDFSNLMGVYLDAVFFPNLEELSFKQEGHRLETEIDPEGTESFKLVYKGVVYNEMKGAMSSADQIMARSLLNALYPSTTYRFNSGGDPAVIPTLTYDQLQAFHQRHYHPSNAYFYTYGNLPLREHLACIHDRILSKFDRIDPRTVVPAQSRWNVPKTVTYPYPLGKDEDPSKKYQVCVAWLTADIQDTFEVLVLILLEQILLGNSGSPLRKALIDSGLGTALSDSAGFTPDNRDTMFACGLKDVEQSAAPKIEAIIFDVLQDLADQGVDKQLIDSAIHQIEFHRKEITNHPYPYGLKLLLLCAGSWLHGGDPVRIFHFDADLEKLHAALAKGPFFENRIRKYFIENPHRVLFTLAPDQAMEQKESERVAGELERIQAALSRSELTKIKRDEESLKTLQEKEEDLSVLPTLALADIPPSIKTVAETDSYKRVPAACYRQPTSGIFYFSSAIGTGSLAKELIPLVPFFCNTFARMGTTQRDYTELAQRIDAYTGGVGLTANVRTKYETAGTCLPFVTFSGKCLNRNLAKMFEIIQELLFNVDFSDLTRLRNLLLEFRAGMESMIVNNGHRLAISLAARNFSKSSALSETWHGIHQLQTIKHLTEDLSDEKLQVISDKLSLIGKRLFNHNNLRMALIGEDEPLSSATLLAASIQKDLEESTDLQASKNGFVPPDIQPGNEVPREGWYTSSAVSFVARTFETVRMGHEDAPALAVISKMLKSMYLHREIREKGGAYGGFAIYNPEDGFFSFGSYRDPHIVSTLKVYDGAGDFIRSGRFDNVDIKEAVLQICSEIDKPDPPGPAARKAFYRKIIALTDEQRRRFKTDLLALTRPQVIQAAERYFDPAINRDGVAVISGEEKLKAANASLKQTPLKLHKI